MTWPPARLVFPGRRVLLALMIPALSAGCSSSPEARPASSPAPLSAASAPVDLPGLDVFVVEATIVGEVDSVLDVKAHPPGTLTSDVLG